MSTSIDQRVVEMRFDNKHFEDNVKTSMSTISELKKSLNLTGAAKGLESVQNAASKFDISPLSGAVQTVSAKFSALEVMAVTALANITNTAVNAGKRIVSSLTIDPIKTGFAEYETQINAIQTILANTSSKGTTLDDVTKALGVLNEYADKTIYNFTEMTKNIGTFTAAGTDLETSTNAIKGIANLAAVSGSTSQQASTAMYQLSQALSSGTVKLMDWNSVVNAGMGGQVFQDSLKETARLHGVAIDDMIKTEGSFRETLKEGWLTSSILTETLSKFTGDLNEDQLKTMGYTKDQITSIIKMGQTANDAATKVKTFTQLFDTLKEAAQSGWTQSWEIMIGDFEEAKESLTKISDVMGGIIGETAKARNDLLKGWKDLGGREVFIKIVQNSFEALMAVIKPVREAFREIFPPTTAKQLMAFSEGLRAITDHLKISDETSDKLKRTFKGLFSVFDIVKQAIRAVATAISPLIFSAGGLSVAILDVAASIGDWITSLNETIKTTNVFADIARVTATVLTEIISAIRLFVNYVSKKFVIPGFDALHNMLRNIQDQMANVGEAAGQMQSGVMTALSALGNAIVNTKFFTGFQKLFSGITKIGLGIASFFSDIIVGIIRTVETANFDKIFDIVRGVLGGGIGLGVIKFVESATKTITSFGDIASGIVDIFDGVRGCLEAYQTQLKAGALVKIAGAIALLAASFLVISTIDNDKMSAALNAITVLFVNLIGSMALFGKIGPDLKGVTKACASMIAISVSILILASALKKISNLSFEDMVTGLVGIMGLTATIVTAAKIMGSGTGGIIRGASGLVVMAVAIKILASACSDLSKLNWTELSKGLVGVGVLLAELSIFLNVTPFSGRAITTATGIVILSAAMKILASACRDFGMMDWGSLAKGLVSIGVLLAEFALFAKLTGNAKHVISTGVAMIAIAAAMKILASAIKDFAMLSWEDLAKGLLSIAGALTIITIAVNLMPKNLVGIGVGLIAVSAALLILAEALGNMGNMSWESVAKGLTVLGGSIAILALGLNAMTGTLAGSAALLVAVAALAILTPILSVLGAMSFTSIMKSLVALAGTFIVLGAAGALLGPLTPVILGLSAALAITGVGVLAIGAGLLAMGAGLSAAAIGLAALATAGAAGATAAMAAIAVIVTGIASLIPVVIGKLGEGIVQFCVVISNSAKAIGQAITDVLLSTLDVLVECIPEIIEGLIEIVAKAITALVTYTPQLVDKFMTFLILVIDGVAQKLPTLIDSAVKLVMAFFSGVIDALKGIDVEVLFKGIAGVGLLTAMMMVLSTVAGFVPGAMVGILGIGAVMAEIALVLAAIGAINQIPGLSWLINEGGEFLGIIGNAIGSFIGGIAGGVIEGVSGKFPQIGTDLSLFMSNIQPFISGAKLIDQSVMAGVNALAATILTLTAANLLDGITTWFTGKTSIVKFGEELAEFGPHFRRYYESIKGVDGSVVVASTNAAQALASFANEIPNSGGLASWFSGENSLSKFADELIVFGPKLKKYADSVRGLDSTVVVNSANAAKVLAEMAANLPNQNGVVGWFTGENDLSSFANELVEFGPALKIYSDSVRGLDPQVIDNSANAAKVLAEMAANLPNQGGILGWFFGENSLSKFGMELSNFGPYLKQYSDSIKGLDGDVITNSANAAKALAELSNNLPNSGGIVSWFTGDNDIASFGAQLVAFGNSFAAYYDSVRNVDTTLLSRVVQEFRHLVDLATGISKIDTGALSQFGRSLTELGYSGVSGFISAFNDSKARVYEAASGMILMFVSGITDNKYRIMSTFSLMIDEIISGMQKRQRDFVSSGSALMINFISGVNSQYQNLVIAVSNLVSGMLSNIQNRYSEFRIAGQSCIEHFSEGMRSQYSNAVNSVLSMVSGCLSVFERNNQNFRMAGKELVNQVIYGVESVDDYLEDAFSSIVYRALREVERFGDDFYDAGEYLVRGFAKGISDNAYLAAEAARRMARSAASAAEDELDEHSPSKRFYKIGDYAGLGFVNALVNYQGIAGDAGRDMAVSAIDGLRSAISRVSDYITDGIESQPVIRPVLDLSEVDAGVRSLNTSFIRNRAVAVSADIDRGSDANYSADPNSSTPTGSISFVQNNYSPKALSRFDLYRQTRNQFSEMERLVRA